MNEGALYAPMLVVWPSQQAEGDSIEASFLLRISLHLVTHHAYIACIR
jgi:alpha-D-ribose 1-methylphosphonate 5-triphosphate synthase subunit PhnI